LGDLISLSASVLIWWRALIAVAGMFVFLVFTKKIRWEWYGMKKMYALGFLIAIHWLCFFGCIKLANASTALICFATISFFTSWIEPLVTGRKWQKHEFAFGLMVIPGIVLIAGKAEGQVLLGIIIGIIAALLVSLIASLEKKWITEIDPEHMTLLQLTGAWVTMCFWLGGELLVKGTINFMPGTMDWIYLLILGLICTCIGWVLATRAIRVVTAFDSMMVINLEPLYGITMALLFLGDARELTTSFYLGAAIILLSVLLHPIWQYRYASAGN
jgi:drug/metabolite transporter (DMT)-like permease